MHGVLDLFSGIGGFSLGLERTGGFKTEAFCEVDEKAQLVLNKHWPSVPVYGDIKELTSDRLRTDGINPTVLAGGFPCTDISGAQQHKPTGIDQPRSGLWSEYARLIDEIRPEYAIVENVSTLLVRGIDRVLRDLAEIGYDAEWHCVTASSIGAPHRRDRIWIVAYANEPRLEGWLGKGMSKCSRQLLTGSGGSRKGKLSDHWSAFTDVCRVAHGVPKRVDRLKQLGNAVVPQIPQLIGQAILEYERDTE